MTDGTKIALGIVAASLVLAATYVGYREYDRSRSIAELREVIGDARTRVLQTRTIPDPEQVRLEASAAPPPDNSLGRRQPDLLMADEQCFNGEVVRQSRLGPLHETKPDGAPARCKDRERLR